MDERKGQPVSKGLRIVKKIVSGGQTGADRAALDFAIAVGLDHGGWVPKGRRAEDGRLPDRYRLREMTTDSYPKRTERNVIDSDATLVITNGAAHGGSALTVRMAKIHHRPVLHLNLISISLNGAAEALVEWVLTNRVSVLNVAGPRASEDPTIYEAVTKVLEAASARPEIRVT